jgi:filamentous hemagglutinin family protein
MIRPSPASHRSLGIATAESPPRTLRILGLGIALLQLITSSALADVYRDGRIGSAGPGPVLSVPDGAGGREYFIRESDGELVGGRNLFHSFERFDLLFDEIATYQGPASVENLITTVTGGPSSIDGLIRSQIDGANLFFINPQGILFGENARINVTGAFAVSTADRLFFENGDFLETGPGPPPAMLSVADPVGFGFLDAPAPISIHGSQIELALDQSLSLVGGDIEILGGRSDGDPGLLSAPSGRIDLASLASAGEVYLDPEDVRIVNATARGDITIADNTIVTTSGLAQDPLAGLFSQPGEGSGPIYIRGRDLLIENADLRTLTVTSEDAGDISIDLTGDFVARSVAGGEQSGIIAGTGIATQPDEGQVVTSIFTAIYPGVTIVEVDVCGAVPCAYRYLATGDAGDVRIKARNVRLESGGRVTARSEFIGDSGTIEVEFADGMFLAGIDDTGERSGFSSTAEGTGNPGSISVYSENGVLTMDDFAAIVIQNSEASLSTSTPGRIDIDVREIDMRGNSRIDSSTRGAGPGGNLDIIARGSLQMSGRSSNEEFTGITTLSQPGSTGDAGTIRITTADLHLDNGAEISARPVGPDAFGEAGNLDLEIGGKLRLRRSTISTESENAAGGNISIRVGKLLDLEDSAITTSVTSGPETGGNISISPGPREALVLDGSQIVAQADRGAGGNIFIQTKLLVSDPRSLVSASSRAGLDGKVLIEGASARVNPEVAYLETPPLDSATLLREPCAARNPNATSSFIVSERIQLTVDADDYLPAPLPRDLRSRMRGNDRAVPDGSDGDAARVARGDESFAMGLDDPRGRGSCAF